MNKKLGQESAFPTNYIDSRNAGMSKRFYAACAAMQGFISRNTDNYYNPSEIVGCIDRSYKLADELLKQENL